MTNTIFDIIKKPSLLFLTLGHRGFFNWISDETYLKIAYRIKMNKSLNLHNPLTYNEKLQWLKLNNRLPLYTMLVDKYEVKKYVSKLIGSEYVIPTLGVWNNFDEINFDVLPNSFVLKCTHDSGGLVIVKDKNNFNKNYAKNKINACLKNNFFWGQREWPYKNVKPRIIVEKFIEDDNIQDLKDYKFFTFNGKVKMMFIATERNSIDETKFDFFDENFVHLPFTNGHPNATDEPLKPDLFEEMKRIAEALSINIPHVRVDLYEVNGKIYFGEMTFFHWSGFVPFQPEEWDLKIGEWLFLPK